MTKRTKSIEEQIEHVASKLLYAFACWDYIRTKG